MSSSGRWIGLTRAEAGGLLVDLYRSTVAVHLDDLTDQALAADADHVEHIGVAHTLCDDQGACDLLNNARTHFG